MKTLIVVVLLNQLLGGAYASPRGSSSSSSSPSLSLTSSLAEMSDLDEEERPLRRLCGWRLANKLNEVCKGIYNKPGSTGNDLFYRTLRGSPYSDISPAYEDVPSPLLAKTTQIDYDALLEARETPSIGDPTSDIKETVEPGQKFESFDPVLPYVEAATYHTDQRAPSMSSIVEELRKSLISSGETTFPFLTRKEATQMLKLHPRSKRGLSAECCRKACRISELMGYCQ